jgi:hypothetical protein
MMQLNMFSGPAKWISKMTTKAKAALEEKGIGMSKKRKPEADRDHTIAQLKKAKTHPAVGNTSNLTAANQGSVTSSIEPSKSPSPPAEMSRRAVVHTEEEEAALCTNEDDLGSKDSKSGSRSSNSESERKEETSEDQLSTFSIL